MRECEGFSDGDQGIVGGEDSELGSRSGVDCGSMVELPAHEMKEKDGERQRQRQEVNNQKVQY